MKTKRKDIASLRSSLLKVNNSGGRCEQSNNKKNNIGVFNLPKQGRVNNTQLLCLKDS